MDEHIVVTNFTVCVVVDGVVEVDVVNVKEIITIVVVVSCSGKAIRANTGAKTVWFEELFQLASVVVGCGVVLPQAFATVTHSVQPPFLVQTSK